ncbi:polysaccharide lyase family 7 protein [uncultured Erythrobacter sp.]|uniref:polysaccharide lyase family 7 protein n=1 Tax=uncultured Erythrobacter sp. TaxID=263913 RepID=UPI002627AE6B|nr:polysaccharide lyase family 7 protein [uncultured Erythrobacter sp.]
MANSWKSNRRWSALVAGIVALSIPIGAVALDDTSDVPGSVFDLSQWKITLPIDADSDGRPDEIDVRAIQDYEHSDYFYLNEEGRMVFVAPNMGTTTANTSNARSELRQMIRGTNTRIGTHDPENNFAVEARRNSDRFGAVGGKLEATLRVDHVSLNAGDPAKPSAYAVVVGQIHAIKYDSTRSGFGYGNEPIKIYFKKFPGHEYGSVFWTYERNLARDNPNRTDLSMPVFGYAWDVDEDPGENGIALGEDFSYTINVHRNTMYLTFHSERLGTVNHQLSLVRGADALDNPYSYGGDSLYFKAGVYNQCSPRTGDSMWYAGCPGTGDWERDRADGNYAQASFSRLILGPSTAPE